MSEGKLRVDGKWLAGFYFNSALARLAAAFDRTVRFKAAGRGIEVKDRRVWHLLRDLGLENASRTGSWPSVGPRGHVSRGGPRPAEAPPTTEGAILKNVADRAASRADLPRGLEVMEARAGRRGKPS